MAGPDPPQPIGLRRPGDGEADAGFKRFGAPTFALPAFPHICSECRRLIRYPVNGAARERASRLDDQVSTPPACPAGRPLP
jgi:hypothetical protein